MRGPSLVSLVVISPLSFVEDCEDREVRSATREVCRISLVSRLSRCLSPVSSSLSYRCTMACAHSFYATNTVTRLDSRHHAPLPTPGSRRVPSCARQRGPPRARRHRRGHASRGPRRAEPPVRRAETLPCFVWSTPSHRTHALLESHTPRASRSKQRQKHCHENCTNTPPEPRPNPHDRTEPPGAVHPVTTRYSILNAARLHAHSTPRPMPGLRPGHMPRAP